VANIWSDGKGLNSFLELNQFLKKDHAIVLVGLNKNQLKKLPSNIIGIERTENAQELADFYNLADVFVNPSIAETFGMVTVEAMACGTPSIVYNTAACPELVSKETGYIIPQNDILDLYKTINVIIENKKDYYSKHCRLRAQELFNKDTLLKKYIDLYSTLISVPVN
jgi:putative colanic acid biosynthesis glycosyltransferase